MAQGCHLLQDLVGIDERGGHQLRCLVGGIAKHDALVASAFLGVQAQAFLNALRDLGGLSVYIAADIYFFPMKTILLVADLLDDIAGRLDHLVMCDDRAIIGAHFSGQHNAIGRGQRFNRDLGR